MYAVKEIYLSIQGEGSNVGRPAVFLRFAGCNLSCRFCDTDFVGTDGPGGGRFGDAMALAAAVERAWPRQTPRTGRAFVVCTGGEPALQLDGRLLACLRARGFEVAVETNGTRALPPGIDWVTVSPKAGAPLVVTRGDELKLAFPQAGAEPALFVGLDFRLFYLQPIDGPLRDFHLKLALDYCLSHPRWRLSVQAHKTLGVA